MKPNVPVFDASWRATCTVEKVGRSEVGTMIQRHYLGKWPGVCVLLLALKRHGVPIGVVVFALPPRETMKRYGGLTWELARLWVDDTAPNNTETYLIGRACRYVRRHHSEVVALVSYADPSAGHSGVIYRASNWVYDGRTDQERKTPRFDYSDANTGKRYSRRSHVPEGANIAKIPRVSKHRFVMHLKP